MRKRVLIVGHADADGHVVAEQARRNLGLLPGLDVAVVVDPERTLDHRAWLNLDRLKEAEAADIILFVDLMFSPMSFAEEATGLVSFARKNPQKLILLVDHHPLPLRRLSEASNLRAIYRPDVFECSVGPRSGMMVVAAICERQPELIRGIRREHHDVIAKGMRRAAAPGGRLAGKHLMTLLRQNRWDLLYKLGSDDPGYHRLVRGRRSRNEALSPTLIELEEIAEKEEESILNLGRVRSEGIEMRVQSMPYDAAAERYVLSERTPPAYENEPTKERDLEALMTLLEVAAISLTDRPDARFTKEELLREARDIGGEAVEIDERDVTIVLEKASFVRSSAGTMQLR